MKDQLVQCSDASSSVAGYDDASDCQCVAGACVYACNTLRRHMRSCFLCAECSTRLSCVRKRCDVTRFTHSSDEEEEEILMTP